MTSSSAGGDALLDSIGSYCSMCELFLPNAYDVWASSSGLLSRNEQNTAPADALILCRYCTAAVKRASTTGEHGLLPHRDRTFSLDASSPFIYELVTVDQILLDDDGKPLNTVQRMQYAVVVGTTAPARSTIALFALNTRYYDEAGRSIRIPKSAYDSLEDPRLRARTEAWNAATRAAARLSRAKGPLLRESVRAMIAGTGFWSTWATVLWKTLHDREMLIEVLMPPAHSSPTHAMQMGSAAANAQGAAADFSGTRSDWLS